MKKIFFTLITIAAFVSCSKTDVAYESTDAIGFQVVTGRMTKAAVNSTTYPTDLNMYVFAMTQTGENAMSSTADYLDNALFAHTSNNLWGGNPAPYYWPNVKKLYFAGISASGNVNNGVVPSYENGIITVDGYVQSAGTANAGDSDLMWFPPTPEAYGKGTASVPVTMKHACSWITVQLAGDQNTAGKYYIKDIHIDGLTTKGKVELGSTADWTLSTLDEDMNKTFSVYSHDTGKALSIEPTEEGFENIVNNTVVLPEQVPGTLSITYTFESQAREPITETVTGSLKFNGETAWVAGTHYIYTVTITASQILIAPTVETWTPSPSTGSHGVTVQ